MTWHQTKSYDTPYERPEKMPGNIIHTCTDLQTGYCIISRFPYHMKVPVPQRELRPSTGSIQPRCSRGRRWVGGGGLGGDGERLCGPLWEVPVWCLHGESSQPHYHILHCPHNDWATGAPGPGTYRETSGPCHSLHYHTTEAQTWGFL